MEILYRVVQDTSLNDVKVRWPTEQEMKMAASFFGNNPEHGDLLKGVFRITDEGRMPCATYTDVDIQNSY